MTLGLSLRDRFLAKVKVNCSSDCIEWTAGTDGRGYGMIRVDGETQRAHRISYELYKGPIPDGLLVCHSCDNRGCVNPGHLFLGTYTDNNADRNAKGRQAFGEKAGRAVLTQEQVAAIREASLSNPELAKLYGISTSAVRSARIGRSWKFMRAMMEKA